MAETGVAMELANEEFQIETHGIDIIPESQRGGTPRGLFGSGSVARFMSMALSSAAFCRSLA